MPNSGGRKNDAHTYCNSMITRIENQRTSARLRATLCIALALAGLPRPTIVAQETPAPPGPGTIDVEIIYDNTTGGADNAPKFRSTSNEKGNEIVLCESSRNVFRFFLFYYGDFVAEGDETCTLRFYANDGEAFHSAAPQLRQPDTLLYESDPTPIGPGNFQAIFFTDINVEVPDRFTWTAEFGGLSGLVGDRARLVYYDVGWEDIKGNSPLDNWKDVDTGMSMNLEKVAVGGTLPFYWEKVDGQWKFTQSNAGPINFLAGIHAHSEDSVRISLTPNDDEIILQGTTGKTVLLEYSHDQQNWRFWKKIDSLPPCGRLTLPISEDFPHPRYFRVQGVEDTEIRLDVIGMSEDGKMELAASGPNDVSCQVQATSDFENWRIVGEYEFGTRPRRVVDDRAAEADFQFYRIRLSSSSQ